MKSKLLWLTKARTAISRGLTEHEFIFSNCGWYEDSAREAYKEALREEQMRQACASEVSEVEK